LVFKRCIRFLASERPDLWLHSPCGCYKPGPELDVSSCRVVSIQEIFEVVGERMRTELSMAFTAFAFIATLALEALVARAHKPKRQEFCRSQARTEGIHRLFRRQNPGIVGTSNEQAREEWKGAHLDENDREKMTAWYRENSGSICLRISDTTWIQTDRDSIKMLKYGRGACWDYGAGTAKLFLSWRDAGSSILF